jgi:hypothetical protein
MSSVCCHRPEMHWSFCPSILDWGGGVGGMNCKTFPLLGLWEEAPYVARMKKCDTSCHLLTLVLPFGPLGFISTSPMFLFLRGLSCVCYYQYISRCWFQRLCRLRCRSAAARLLRSWVRIPPGAWMFVCCECCVLSGRGLCDELTTHPEDSSRLWCVVVCDIETSSVRSQTSIDCD